MKLGFFIAASVMAAVLAGAQDIGKSKTRVIVEDGKEVTVTGCVQRNAKGSYMLTNVAGKDGASGSYILARLGDSDDDKLEDLAGNVGKRVEVTGKAADRGDGKIRVETRSEVKKADGDTAKTETRSEVKGDLDGLPYLGVKSSRMIASVCP
jgi:hypothetical protein